MACISSSPHGPGQASVEVVVSYVRWSTPISLPEGVDPIDYYLDKDNRFWNIPTSDLYIYDHVGGFVSVNVAGNRHTPTRPFIGERVIDVDPKTRCGRPNPAWWDWLDEGRETIDHPDAGQSFDFEDMADAIAKVEELIAAGFLAPAWLVEEMRAELANHAPESISPPTNKEEVR